MILDSSNAIAADDFDGHFLLPIAVAAIADVAQYSPGSFAGSASYSFGGIDDVGASAGGTG
jgi:hypothetical protein